MTDLLTLCTTALALAGLLAGFITARRLRLLTAMIVAFGEEAACYYRISRDGEITIEEEQEMGRAAIRFFERVEELGIEVLNRDTCGT
ncbi:MAG: hypothetical protein QMD46_09890 [Methanomicrobiales archaeon]|nr:hypothetical protein [Methanomicrobiales archaeon]MDI6876787.1 hypothetical protein [Methanomicrobiales archaeon]